jgi:hypothetical protein
VAESHCKYRLFCSKRSWQLWCHLFIVRSHTLNRLSMYRILQSFRVLYLGLGKRVGHTWTVALTYKFANKCLRKICFAYVHSRTWRSHRWNAYTPELQDQYRCCLEVTTPFRKLYFVSWGSVPTRDLYIIHCIVSYPYSRLDCRVGRKEGRKQLGVLLVMAYHIPATPCHISGVSRSVNVL